jgi:hypothetical protein
MDAFSTRTKYRGFGEYPRRVSLHHAKSGKSEVYFFGEGVERLEFPGEIQILLSRFAFCPGWSLDQKRASSLNA